MLSQDPKNLQNSSEVTFYMLNNNFPYTQVASAHVRVIILTPFFLFLIQQNLISLISFYGLFSTVAFSFLLKDFYIFYMLLLEAFI